MNDNRKMTLDTDAFRRFQQELARLTKAIPELEKLLVERSFPEPKEDGIRLLILAESYNRALGYAQEDCTPPLNLRGDKSVAVVIGLDDFYRLRGTRLTSDFEVVELGLIRGSIRAEANNMLAYWGVDQRV